MSSRGESHVLREWLVGFCWHVHSLLVSRLGIGLRGGGQGIGSVTPRTGDLSSADATRSHVSRTSSLFSSPVGGPSNDKPAVLTPASLKSPLLTSVLTRETHTMTDQELMKIIHIVYNLMLWALNTMDLCKEKRGGIEGKIQEVNIDVMTTVV